MDSFITHTKNLQGSKSGLETEVVHLNYIESSVVVQSFRDLLSPRGSLKPLDITAGKGSGSTNKVLITDSRESIDQLEREAKSQEEIFNAEFSVIKVNKNNETSPRSHGK